MRKNGQLLKVDGADIYFEISGKESSSPLLLLHGGVGSIEDFDVLLPSLRERFRVIAIDSRGHGRSTLGDCILTYQKLEEDVVEVLGYLNMDSVAILGFSDGGIVGYRLMASSAIEITKLATIGSTVELGENDPVREIYSNITGASWRERFPASYESYQAVNPQPDFDQLIALSVGMWLDSTQAGYPAKSIAALNGGVLIMRGDGDHLFDRDQAADSVSKIPRAAFANIPFAGHAAHDDQPEIVLSCLKALFLLGTEETIGL